MPEELPPLSEEQAKALLWIQSWLRDYYDGLGDLFVTLGGFAGTGKTTLIRHLIEEITNVRVCALAGKAAHVLRSKGVKTASTIHGLIYEPIVYCKTSLLPVVDCKTCRDDPQLCIEDPEHPPRCRFTEVSFRRAALINARLIIVDEASMVNTTIFDDLCSFGVPILFVGDHGQLEPIGDNPRLMKNPMFRLETIHRQKEASPIIEFAHNVRMGQFPSTTGQEARVVDNLKMNEIHTFDVVLCGTRKTAKTANDTIRENLGHSGPLPHTGERVMCLRNDSARGVFNGMCANVVEVIADEDGDGVLMSVQDDVGNKYADLPVWPEQFATTNTLDRPISKTLWTYGYAMTVHKAQGSEWPRVCVLEWLHPNWSAGRWRYTAATRASHELVYRVQCDTLR